MPLRRLTERHPQRGNPCCGFELMKICASAVCASLSMTDATTPRRATCPRFAKNWRKHVTAVDNTMTAP
jgi:hypothetical protein